MVCGAAAARQRCGAVRRCCAVLRNSASKQATYLMICVCTYVWMSGVLYLSNVLFRHSRAADGCCATVVYLRWKKAMNRKPLPCSRLPSTSEVSRVLLLRDVSDKDLLHLIANSSAPSACVTASNTHAASPGLIDRGPALCLARSLAQTADGSSHYLGLHLPRRTKQAMYTRSLGSQASLSWS